MLRKLSYIFAVVIILASCSDDDSAPCLDLDKMPRGTLVSVTQEKHLTSDEFIDTYAYRFPTVDLSDINDNILLPQTDITIGNINVNVDAMFNIGKLVANVIKPAMKINCASLEAKFACEQKTTRASYELQTYSYTFRSVGYDGKPVILSAVIAFPNSKDSSHPHNIHDICINHHAKIVKYSLVPSIVGDVMLLRALQDKAIIVPDYEGMGASREHFFAPMEIVTNAKQSIDAIRAAKQVMERAGIKLSSNFSTENFGISQGGEMFLGLHHYYDVLASKEEKDDVRLKRSFGGSGVMRPHMFFSNPEDIEGDYDSPNVELALNTMEGIFEVPSSQFEGFNPYDDFFNDTFKNLKAEVEGTTMAYYDIRRLVYMTYSFELKIFPNYHMVFQPDMLTPDSLAFDKQSSKVKALFGYLKSQDIGDGWKVETPLTYIWSDQDYSMYPAMQRSTYENLRCTSPLKVKKHVVPLPVSGGTLAHFMICTYYYLKCIIEE